MNFCSFFGHKDLTITEEIKSQLQNIVENLIINENYNSFYFGEYGDFDNICYEIVSKLKTIYPQINRIYVATNEKTLSKHKRTNAKTYEQQIVLPLHFNWWYQIIYYRNLAIIDNSNFIIFYITNENNSGANKALQYAIKTKKHYINVANCISND